jgi:hypothetical protein
MAETQGFLLRKKPAAFSRGHVGSCHLTHGSAVIGSSQLRKSNVRVKMTISSLGVIAHSKNTA